MTGRSTSYVTTATNAGAGPGRRATVAAVADTIDDLAGRPGWTVEGVVATYAPEPGSWTAKVRLAQQAKYYARWHVAIIGPDSRARYVSHASLLGEAVRVAERTVRGQGS